MHVELHASGMEVLHHLNCHYWWNGISCEPCSCGAVCMLQQQNRRFYKVLPCVALQLPRWECISACQKTLQWLPVHCDHSVWPCSMPCRCRTLLLSASRHREYRAMLSAALRLCPELTRSFAAKTVSVWSANEQLCHDHPPQGILL